MKLHRAVALALVGWYLMLPLVKDGKIRDLPVQFWSHVDSFDSANECRDAAYQLIEREKRRGDTDKITAAMTFECIASDDPRLK